ncbi:MAG: hypothetical protein IJI66_01310 [Erysipelotrichaceae bacterium]|nr:hypothetical protein [Erysipelotrichaceae bacterium]
MIDHRFHNGADEVKKINYEANKVVAILESEINSLNNQIKRNREAITKMEAEFAAAEEDSYLAAVDYGMSEEEARKQADTLHQKNQNSEAYVRSKQLLKEEEWRLGNLKLDRDIYLYYLNNNEEAE